MEGEGSAGRRFYQKHVGSLHFFDAETSQAKLFSDCVSPLDSDLSGFYCYFVILFCGETVQGFVEVTDEFHPGSARQGYLCKYFPHTNKSEVVGIYAMLT